MKHSRLSTVYLGLLLFIFGFIVLHAPFTVVISTLAPTMSDIAKSWKEILLLAALVILIVILARKKQFALLKDPILLLIGAYIALHIVTAIVTLALGGTLASVAAGLLIDLRYVVYFGLVFVGVLLFPQQRKNFFKVFMFGACLVMLFALLQVFVLPADILTHIGYGPHTIEPYLTVDKNTDYIRINSTLRGPNPLGAYAVIVLGVMAVAIAQRKIPPMLQSRIMAVILVAGGSVALWASYSRSALLAGVAAIVIALGMSLFHKLRLRTWIALAAVAIVITTGFLVTNHDSRFVSNVLLHENPNGGSQAKSNEGHVSSLQDGVVRLIRQPLGAGIGSTGTASYYDTTPLTIENQYLFIAHEVGWIGLLLFLCIFIEVMRRLWLKRKDWLALGVFAGGIGMAFIGLLLPVWADDTVSLIWWGLAAVALAGAKK